ncbi:MAG: glucose 1-dehydrogenase [Rhodococcus sp. (in: high G+C Gram-positive bacteria)]|jgi:3alpha(or 20beta)-hydroxysteroid dehydrogenase|uniref:glucose 1-dehydrogenase n=1 Tax=Rhodococcus sp. EPR-157 TaxID=1813677 RepID=UPI0007BB4B85|nr:glucose 1-dehydrogenase [Rhodococcus sp. EPR-157]KZF03959.1 3-alpha-hydroxysteroid dehydrogenase [Rhodococcus sp. EPR-157]
MNRLSGRVALVSGAARGMGLSHCRAMVAEGAQVVLGDILDDEGRAAAESLGDAARYVHLDVTSPESWEETVRLTTETFGPPTVLVNNAGIVNGNLITAFEPDEWRRIVDINLTGTFLGIRACAQTMIDAGGGSIVNISSVEGFRGSPGLHGYTATKFAVRGLTKSVALELAPHKIRVNSVHPGFVRTPMTDGIPEDFLQIPLGRGADASEVAAMVVFLASDESSYSTGSEFIVDGGLMAGVPHRTFE